MVLGIFYFSILWCGNCKIRLFVSSYRPMVSALAIAGLSPSPQFSATQGSRPP